MKPLHIQFADRLAKNGFSGDISNHPLDIHEHSTDESIFSVEPGLIIYPKTATDIELAVQVARDMTSGTNPLSLTARAAGSGLAGGSLNDSVIVNTTKYLKQIIRGRENKDGSVDYTVEPGLFYPELEVVMDKKGVYIPSLPASKDICCIGGMVGNNAAGADTFRYGHTSQYVQSLKIVLSDGKEYSIHNSTTYEQLSELLEREDSLGELYRTTWDLIQTHEQALQTAKPITKKNTAGYPLWDVLDVPVSEFKNGQGSMNITNLISGSQGTLGIITELTMRAVPKVADPLLMIVPIYDLNQAGNVIGHLVKQNPLNVELYDGLTFSLAHENIDFFVDRMSQPEMKKFMKEVARTYRKEYKETPPPFTVLAAFEPSQSDLLAPIGLTLKNQFNTESEVVSSPTRQNMFWQIRRASYSLSKLADPNMRPAAFLEDMSVKPQYIGDFFRDIQELFIEHNIHAAIHGHGGNGHLHFYPLMDFTDPATAQRIPLLSEKFFAVAKKYHGTICGEHNDGIIRTPYLSVMFPPEIIKLFEIFERACDPKDIFNPGKKVNPKFDVQKYMRHTN